MEFIPSRSERNSKKLNILKILQIKNKDEIFCFHPETNCYGISNKGRVIDLLKNRYIKLYPNKAGYLYVSYFSDVDKKRKTISIHKMVMETFNNLPNNIKQLLEINHIDGNKTNNNLDNLEWVTRKENIVHSVELRKKGLQKKSSVYKLTQSDIDDIKTLYKLSFNIKDIAKSYNISYEYTRLIIKGKVRNENF